MNEEKLMTSPVVDSVEPQGVNTGLAQPSVSSQTNKKYMRTGVTSISQLSKDQLQKSLAAQQKRDRTLVRGKFTFHESPGSTLEFDFRKYKQDPIEKYSFKDQEIYTIPLGVAKHLNTNISYKSYHYKKDASGKDVTNVGESVRRCSFQSLEFLDK